MSGSRRFHLDPPRRILLGPGPSEVPARVLAALGRPTVGYLDSSYVNLLEEVRRQLKLVFRTENEATFAITGSGTAAMEAAIFNAIEPGDRAVVCVHGYFGDRMRQILERAEADVHVVEQPWGQATSPTQVEDVIAQLGGAKAIAVIHGETSTGVCQPLEELGAIARKWDALLIVDAVASLGGTEFATDDWNIDIAYTGGQKCLSVPPGISPITFGPRALQRIEERKTPCRSWYLDAKLNLTYWDRPHKYHHTGPINLTYALHEGLNIIESEGLAERIEHTTRLAEALWAGLQALGLDLLVQPKYRLPTLTTVRVPKGVEEQQVRAFLMDQHGVEIAGGLGPLAGITWRIGLMGASAQVRHVTLLLAAMEIALREQGHQCPPFAGVAAATECLRAR